MVDKSEGYLKAKDCVDAIDDINFMLHEYENAGVGCIFDKDLAVLSIFYKIRRLFTGKNGDELTEFYGKSSFSSEFMVDLHDFLVEEREKFNKKLRILE